ncbi:MAG TPA: aminodeoxychorismate/anthranilate synthase component II, partial [Casimicrobiaceae bacterium]|nr:aminodeoxychorismate/anthranilate synthase component II [Casimicrobiaceae bacterium]
MNGLHATRKRAAFASGRGAPARPGSTPAARGQQWPGANWPDLHSELLTQDAGMLLMIDNYDSFTYNL